MNGAEPKPHVEGFTVVWDPKTKEWVATSYGGNFVLRAKTAVELLEKRRRVYEHELFEFRATIRGLRWPETNPTPRDW